MHFTKYEVDENLELNSSLNQSNEWGYWTFHENIDWKWAYMARDGENYHCLKSKWLAV